MSYRLGEPMSDEDSLAHYGVKGMKWGRHSKSKSGPALLPWIKPSMAVGRKVGQKIHDFNNKKDSSGVSRREARQEVRKENRQHGRNLEDFERSGNRSDQIRSARANALNAHRRYQDIKSEVKAGKRDGTIGKHAAKVVMARARNERYANIHKAESKTTGEQLIEAFFAPRTTR